MLNLAKCYLTQSCQKWSYLYRILTNASREYISKCSCHLRAFKAIADVANYGKSGIVPKVAIFGNLRRQVLPLLANFMDCQNQEKNLAMHKNYQKWQLKLAGQSCHFWQLLVATLFNKSCQKWQILVIPKVAKNGF